MVILTRYVKALCPAQAIDEYTPDAWLDVLGEYGAQECRAAVTELAGEQPFIAVADIRKHVLAARRAAAGRRRVAELAAADPAYASVRAIESGAARRAAPEPLASPLSLGAAIAELAP